MLKLPGYQIDAEIYTSPRTRVYRGVSQDGKRVVFKMLGPGRDATDRARLRYEFRVASDLAVAGVYRPRALLLDGTVAIFEDIGGESLAAIIERGPLPLGQVLQIGLQVARILSDVHRRHVVHKDINPANIVLNASTGEVQLIDFGIASLIPKEMQSSKPVTALEGTLAYMAPEQTGRMNRSLDYRSDYYALGATLYQLITGKTPHQAADLAGFVHAVLATSPTPPQVLVPSLPPVVARIVTKLLSKEPRARYQSGFGLAWDLERCCDSLRTSGTIADFAVGARDRNETFAIPERLYGREPQVAELLACYDNARRERSAVALLCGPSGVGKTALVGELAGRLAATHGLLVSGKFDQYASHMPYSALGEAITKVVKHILALPSGEVDKWRDRVLAAVGDMGALVSRAVPAVELFIGRGDEPPDLPPSQAQERFKYTMVRFLRSLASREAPLVLLLDDMQWADRGTIDLLQSIAADRESVGLFLVCAYRDQEVPAGHPFAIVCQDLRQRGLVRLEVQTPPMTLDSIAALVRDALRSSPADSLELAAFLLHKTHGIAFFVRELLRHLYAQDLLQYEPDHDKWTWNMAALAAAGVTTSVAQLLLTKLSELPDETRRALQLAAFLGNNFDLQMLAAVANVPAVDMARHLSPAISGGILVPASADYRFAQDADERDGVQVQYKFAHDRLHEVTHDSSPESERPSMHRRIGTALLRRADASNATDLVAQALEHLNTSADLATDREERLGLARRNFAVGQTSLRASAISTAKAFLAAGVELMGDGWATDYAVLRSAHLALSDCELLAGDIDAALARLDLVYERSDSEYDRAHALLAKVKALNLCGRAKDAVPLTVKGLAHVGLRVQRRPPPWWIVKRLVGLKPLIRRTSVEALRLLEEEPDKNTDLALTLLNTGALAGALVDPVFYMVCIFNSDAIVRRVRTPWLASVLGGQASLLSGMGDIALALHSYDLSSQALALYPEGRSAQVLNNLAMANLALPFAKSWSDLRVYARNEAKEAAANGQVFERDGFTVGTIHMAHMCGAPSDTIEEEASDALQYVRSHSVAAAIILVRQLRRCLRGATAGPASFTDPTYDSDAVVEAYRDNHEFDMWRSHYWSLRNIAAYVHRDFATCREVGWPSFRACTGIMYSLYWAADGYLFIGLSVLAQAQPTWRERYLLTRVRRLLRYYEKVGRINFLGYATLLEAQVAANRGNIMRATQLFETANKQLAERTPHISTVAHECAGRFYLLHGLDVLAESHLRAAYAGYSAWQATLKLRALRDEFSFLSSDAATNAANTNRHGTGTSRGQRGAIDAAAIIKASQTLSATVDPDRLLAEMLSILMENTGADAGLLALYDAQKHSLEVKVTAPASANAAHSMPVTVFQYVERTREAVVLDDATTDAAFNRDPYIVARQPKSVLCYPVVRGGNLVAIAYLENSLVTGAFTRERQDVIGVLIAQAAISLENAGFYRALESKIADRTRALEEAQRRVVQLERAATEMRMGTGFAAQTRTLLRPAGDALSDAGLGQTMARYTASCEQLAGLMLQDTASRALREQRNAMQTLLRDHDVLTESVGVATHAISRGLRIAETILQFASQTAPGDRSSAVRMADVIDEVLRREAARIAQYGVALSVETPEGCEAKGNADHLRTILAHTVANALDALARRPSPESGPTLRVACKRIGGRIEVVVADNGTGMAPEVQARIFEPFFSTSPTDRIGLGLPLVRRLVNMYDGRIDVTSAPGEGTQLRITL